MITECLHCGHIQNVNPPNHCKKCGVQLGKVGDDVPPGNEGEHSNCACSKPAHDLVETAGI